MKSKWWTNVKDANWRKVKWLLYQERIAGWTELTEKLSSHETLHWSVWLARWVIWKIFIVVTLSALMKLFWSCYPNIPQKNSHFAVLHLWWLKIHHLITLFSKFWCVFHCLEFMLDQLSSFRFYRRVFNCLPRNYIEKKIFYICESL